MKAQDVLPSGVLRKLDEGGASAVAASEALEQRPGEEWKRTLLSVIQARLGMVLSAANTALGRRLALLAAATISAAPGSRAPVEFGSERDRTGPASGR